MKIEQLKEINYKLDKLLRNEYLFNAVNSISKAFYQIGFMFKIRQLKLILININRLQLLLNSYSLFYIKNVNQKIISLLQCNLNKYYEIKGNNL